MLYINLKVHGYKKNVVDQWIKKVHGLQSLYESINVSVSEKNGGLWGWKLSSEVLKFKRLVKVKLELFAADLQNSLTSFLDIFDVSFHSSIQICDILQMLFRS